MSTPLLSLRRCSGGTLAARAARQTWPKRSGLLLELVAGSHRGLGEASPLPGYSSDTLEEAEGALATLDRHALALALEQEHPLEALAAAAKLVPAGQSAARMALESPEKLPAALAVLERAGFRIALMDAIEAAANRSKELS